MSVDELAHEDGGETVESSESGVDNKVGTELRGRAVSALVQRFGFGVLRRAGVSVERSLQSYVDECADKPPRREHFFLLLRPEDGETEVWDDPSAATRKLVERAREFVAANPSALEEVEACLEEVFSIEAVMSALKRRGVAVVPCGEFLVRFFGDADPGQVCGATYLRLEAAIDAIFRGRPLPIGFEDPTEHERAARRSWALLTISVFWLATDKTSRWRGGPFAGPNFVARSSAYWALPPSRQQELCGLVERALDILEVRSRRRRHASAARGGQPQDERWNGRDHSACERLFEKIARRTPDGGVEAVVIAAAVECGASRNTIRSWITRKDKKGGKSKTGEAMLSDKIRSWQRDAQAR